MTRVEWEDKVLKYDTLSKISKKFRVRKKNKNLLNKLWRYGFWHGWTSAPYIIK